MGYLKGKRCYLSGAIEHSNSFDWRKEPKQILTQQFGAELFDPFADPKQQWVPKLNEARQKKDFETMSSIAKAFVKKDLCLVDRCDFLIAYLPYRCATTGTHHEIINSCNAKKPTLLICPDGKEFLPLWYFGFIPTTAMFGSWKELFSYLQEVDQGQHKDNSRWWYSYGLV